MARSTTTRRIEQLDSGSKKVESASGQPAVETENARFEVLGPFRHANLAIDLSAVAMTLGGVDSDAPQGIVAPRAGAIVGITYASDAAISAGGASAMTLQASVSPGGVAGTPANQGSAFVVASGGAQSASLDMVGGSIKKPTFDAGFVPFNEGDWLQVLLSTSHTFAPTTADVDVYLAVRWAS